MYCRTQQITFSFVDFPDDYNCLHGLLTDFWYPGTKLNVELLCFYSPKDLILAFGWSNIVESLLNTEKMKYEAYIDQKSNYSGKSRFDIVVYNIKDLYGWAVGSKGKLLGLANSLNIPMEGKKEGKNDLDGYKSCMLKAVEEMGERFLDYSFNDVNILIVLHLNLLKSMMNIIF